MPLSPTAPVDAVADHVAALDEVAGDVERRLMAAQVRLQEAERARLAAARSGSPRPRHWRAAASSLALAVARSLLAERASAADRPAVHVEDGERR